MGIKFIPPEFPAQRRQDPRRNAEAKVFDALQRMNLTGHGIYEYRGPRGGTQVDLALWADMVARIAGPSPGAAPSGPPHAVVPVRRHCEGRRTLNGRGRPIFPSHPRWSD